MEETRKKALKLAEFIGTTKDLSSNAVHEAEDELREYLKIVDSDTQKEIMERIRAYS
ncbi:MAG: hypothetical protein HY695_30260 [Deltaproteobacteria bacterium]|nr:hypothetical protein [Deltaproteobacteria bacterium]